MNVEEIIINNNTESKIIENYCLKNFKEFNIKNPNETILGMFYEFGLFGRKIDYKKAFELYNIGVNQKNSYAMYLLGKMYINDNIISQDTDKAINLFKDAIELKNPYAMCGLASIYLYNKDIDIEEIMKLFYEAIKLNNIFSMITLSFLHIEEGRIEKDVNKAIQLANMAYNINDKDINTLILLGAIYMDEINNTDKALIYLETASNLGSINAKYLLGQYYYKESININNDGDYLSKEKAIKYYNEAIELGSSDAMVELAINIYRGQNSKELLEKAAKLNNPDALYHLAYMYEAKKDYNKAKELYNMAIKLGNTSAKYKYERLINFECIIKNGK